MRLRVVRNTFVFVVNLHYRSHFVSQAVHWVGRLILFAIIGKAAFHHVVDSVSLLLVSFLPMLLVLSRPLDVIRLVCLLLGALSLVVDEVVD